MTSGQSDTNSTVDAEADESVGTSSGKNDVNHQEPSLDVTTVAEATNGHPMTPPPTDQQAAAVVRKFGNIAVFFKHADTLRLGDVVQGWVEVTLNRPLTIRRMTVTFYGEVEYEQAQRIRRRRFESQSQELWREPHRSERGARLERGFYVYEFLVGTRIDLPAAFLSRSGAIQSLLYYCEVSIAERPPTADSATRGPITEHIKRTPLCLKAPSLSSLSPDIAVQWSDAEAASAKGVMYVRNLLDQSGTIAVTLLLARRRCRPGDRLPIRVELLNCFRRLKLYVSLVERAKRVRLPSAHSAGDVRDVLHELYCIQLAEVKATEAYRRIEGEQLWIPDGRLSPVQLSMRDIDAMGEDKSSKLIHLGHSVILTVKPIVGKSLLVELPLVVSHTSGLLRKHQRLRTCNSADTVIC